MKKALKTVLIIAFWVGVWYVASLAVNKPLLFPSPFSVIKRAFELSLTKDFWRICLLSLLRVSGGIVSGLAFALAIAVLTSKFKLFRSLIYPLITMIKATPIASFVILVLLFIGRELLPVFITFLIVFPVIWTNLDEGIAKTDKQLLELSRVYKLGKLKTLRFVYIPSVFPYFASSARTSLGLAWKAGIAAEVISVPALSIGKMLIDAKTSIEMIDLFAWTLVVILFSLLIEVLFVKLLKMGERRKTA